MSVPSPPVPLTGGCSTVYDNTLYTFQQDAFQSLPLSAGASWSSLPSGVAVNGSRCVLGTQDGQDVLWIVGGVAQTNPLDFSGLQRFRFSDKSWETIVFEEASVVSNRVQHGATFLNDTSTILVYAGYQDNSDTNTSETFTITTNSSTPQSQSFTSNAPPATDPLLLPWNDTHAVMAGGSTTNQQVWIFSQDNGWSELNVVLPPGLPDLTQVQASLVQGQNGSKILELFDMSANPNTVTALLLSPGESGSAPQEPNKAVKLGAKRSEISDRAVDLTDWPQYNDTFAPSIARSGYNVAQTPSGLVVISGGASQNGDSVAMFNQTANSWISAENFFNPSNAAAASAPASSATAPPSAATSAAAAAAAAASSGGGLDNDQRTILGAVLGGIFGLIALAIIALLILRGLKQRQSRKRKGSDYGQNEKKNVLVVDETAATGIDRAALSPAASSFFSATSSPMRRNFAKRDISSPHLESESLSPDQTSFAQTKPSPAMMPTIVSEPPRRESPRTMRTDEGWSQYFANDIERPRRDTHYKDSLAPPDARNTAYTDQSDYSTSTNARISAEVAPLNLAPGESVPREAKDESFLDSSTEQESWGPLDGSSYGGLRPASSLYDGNSNTSSVYHPHPGERVLISRFPSVPQSRAASIVQLNDNNDRGMRTTAAKNLGTSRTSNPEPLLANPAHGSLRRTSGHVDNMSWLNLGSQTSK